MPLSDWIQEASEERGMMRALQEEAPCSKNCDAGVACAIDGCRVECDGVCEHGFPSKMLVMGMI